MRVLNGDCRELFKGVEDASVDSIVTDPPYELGFMGKAWDASGIAYDESVWREALRVLKPGGHLLAFGGSRTYHRMACAIEDAGFEVRDQMMWLYGSGFPKSLDVSKAIDKAAGAEREVVGTRRQRGSANGVAPFNTASAPVEEITKPATATALRWQGWGTALKPAHEPIVVARKPFKGTVAGNVLEHGTGAINIDACRIGATVESWPSSRSYGSGSPVALTSTAGEVQRSQPTGEAPNGRWPANVILDEEAGALLDEQSGTLKSGANPTRRGADTGRTAFGKFDGQVECVPARDADTGGASRFFYCAKASNRERNAGLEEFAGGKRPAAIVPGQPQCRVCGSRSKGSSSNEYGPTCGHNDWEYVKPREKPHKGAVRNPHPTVKPIALMRYLVRLVTPKGGLVLDPFTGSGTTGIAAVLEGMEFLGFEQDEEYARIADARIGFWQKDQQMNLDLGLAA